MLSSFPVRARQSLALVSLVLVLGIYTTPRVAAQTTSGTLVGTVYKPTGEPLGGARVTASNELNGNSRSTLTSADGSYRIPFMPPGRYTIRASFAGFTDNQITGFPIPLNSTTNLVPPITLGAAGGTGTGPVVTPTGPGGQTVTPSTRTEGEGRVSLINTNDPTRRGNFSIEQVSSLPLGGTTETRTFDELALLAPGVAAAPYVPGVRGPGVGFGIGTAGQFSVNGSRARANNFTVDGSDNNDPDVGVRRQGFVSLVPQSIESVQEFQLSTLLWDAESGRNVGSQVNAVSRTGGNEFHGTLYGFFTDSSLNARNSFDFTGGASGDENPYTRVQAGFVIGGPIVKDRTQFFASYERQDINASIEQHFSTPTLASRRFLGLPEFGVLRPIPLPAFAEIAYSTTSGSTPLGANVLSLYPLPNNPGGPYGENTYTQELPSSGGGNIVSFKVTHKFNDTNDLNVRYNFTDDDRLLPAVNRAINSTIGSETRTHNLSLILDTALSDTLFNQARFSYGRTELDFPEQPGSPFIFQASSTVPVQTPGGTVLFGSDTSPIGQLIIEPFSPVGVDVFTFPQGRTNNTYQFADSMSWTVGRHSMKFGGDIRLQQLNSFNDRNYRPQVVYGNGIQAFGLLTTTGLPNAPFGFNPLSSILALPGLQLATVGVPSSIFQVISKDVPDSSIKLRFAELNFFFNDSWRVRPNFVLDFGVRYEYNTVPTEADNVIEDALSLSNVPATGSSQFDSVGSTFFYNNAVNAVAGFYGGREKIYENDPNNFGPHLGFAWDPWSNGRTSLRGGYGVYFDSILGAVVSQSRNVFPNEVPINVDPSFLGTNVFNLPAPSTLVLTDGGNSVPLIKPGTINQFGGSQADFGALIGTLVAQNFGVGGLAITLPELDIATPYVQQWHLTLEQEFLNDYTISAAYVGTKGTKLTRLTTPNLGPNVTPFLPTVVAAPGTPYTQGPPLVVADVVQTLLRPRPNPFLGAIQRFENSANSNYHALQIEAKKRYSNGYMYTFSYTWSHAIDAVSDVFPIAGSPVIAQDSFNLNAERASASFDVRHRFAASLIWDLPIYRDVSAPEVDDAAFWLGGWQVSTLAQGATGQPFTLNVPFDSNLDGNLTDRPLTTNGLTFIDSHGPQRVDITDNFVLTDYVSYDFFFGPNGQLFLNGQNGAVGRNTVRADGQLNWDAAITKRFRFTENQNLEFRTEIFNLLNRTNYGIPIRTLFNPGFGSSIETSTPNRVIQFALKYSF
jgi:hypothetical protein